MGCYFRILKGKYHKVEPYSGGVVHTVCGLQFDFRRGHFRKKVSSRDYCKRCLRIGGKVS